MESEIRRTKRAAPSYLKFERLPAVADRITDIWSVTSTVGHLLGQIKWMPRWRQYCFYPEPATIFNKDCMREIADKCQTLTTEHKRR